ncbi:unnamed protein product [Arabidopsis arenosa]|uniref:Uncharacterized protein n=1 Tax=Arabidopsis arenosa TaxID=38785 RepID=A0A8S1ZR62_ARAAE|nr:unnamed protein product [Arabidopsis arenosa]
MNAPRITPDLPVSIMSLDKEKSWYDQTVEEEEKEARDAPLETRFSSAIQIGEDPSAIPAILDPGTEEMDFEGVTGDGDMDWEENNHEEDHLDLDWVEEEDEDYCENENSMSGAGENLETDDLLGDEMEDLERNKEKLNNEKKKICGSPVSDLGLGPSKSQGMKKEKIKRALTPKAQFGQTSVQDLIGRVLNVDSDAEGKTINIDGNEIYFDLEDKKMLAPQPPDQQLAPQPPDQQLAPQPPDQQLAPQPPDQQLAPQPPDQQLAPQPPDQQLALPLVYAPLPPDQLDGFDFDINLAEFANAPLPPHQLDDDYLDYDALFNDENSGIP